MPTHGYAFDVTLNAVARVEADTEASARRVLRRVLDAISLNVVLCDGPQSIRITEASAVFDSPDDPILFEIDGVMLDSE